LIVAALIFSVVAALFRQPPLARSAYYCTLLAGIFLFPTVLFGIMDWQHFYAGDWLVVIKWKMVLASILIVSVFTSVFLVRKKGDASKLVMGNYLVSFVLVVALGYLGGNLVYGEQQAKAGDKYQAGMQLFDNHCLSCHPKGGNIINPAKPILNSLKTDNFKDFLAFLRQSQQSGGVQRVMPSFSPQTLSDADAKKLYQYITKVLQKR
jgi:cytochrome c6